MQKISTCLWFDGQAGEAAEFYTSTFANASMGQPTPGPDGTVIMVGFEIGGREFMALNGRPGLGFTEAISLVVNCENQDEVDRYWDALVDGGEEGRCGWLKDKFGVSWQIIPTAMPEFLNGQDEAGSRRAMEAMMTMGKLDLAVLKKAYDGD
ncbi:VOC family protein [Paenarthrobacter sp. YJN-D]|uniref:VOC family protein n=1 Tax=Paenarthrobacter sp. YJN-D TaxID=2735317 RepID=UPI0018778DEE|nr:VOC family protein [Paenarthrobacter sp. YJN-D]QOT20672.1 VOC family protein [Paenarthrobacter sp. YJN-D]